jgi:hypothetical protein
VETERRMSYLKLRNVEKKQYRMCGSDRPNKTTMVKLAVRAESNTARTRPTYAFKCFAGYIPRSAIVLQRNEQQCQTGSQREACGKTQGQAC